MPTARAEFASTVLDGQLYVAGGFLGPQRVTDELERFDPASGTWETLAPLPVSQHHFAMAGIDGALYAIGGYPHEGGFADDVRRYDSTADIWTAVAPLPAPRGAHTTAVIYGLIYVVGGVSPVEDADRTVSVYDPSTDTWTNQEQLMPTKREHLVAVNFEDQLWVLGGRTGENLATVEIFDPQTGTWSSGPDLAVATSGHTAAVLGDRIHVTGGEFLVAFTTIPDHQVIGSGDDTWRLDVESPLGRHGLGSGVIDDRWYVVGGGSGPDLSVSNLLDIWVDPSG